MYKKKPKVRWISQETWKLIDERNDLRQQIFSASGDRTSVFANVLYRLKDKEIKKSAKADKRRCVEEKARLAEEAARKGDSKAVYRLTNEMIGKLPIRSSQVKDESGNVLTETEKIDERWVSHFEKVLNRLRPTDQESIPSMPSLNLKIDENPPTSAEMLVAVKKLKNGRSPGEDCITSETIKASMRTCLPVWITLISTVWQFQKVPGNWTKGIIVNILRKGDALNCAN